MAKIKLTMFDWNNGVWGNRTAYFQNFEDARKQMKKERGRGKIYNNKNQVIYSENIGDNSYTNE